MKFKLSFLFFLLTILFDATAFAADEKHSFTLVIDAGHGGHDAGAVGAYSKEKDINLKVALAFGRLVEDNCPDVKIIYTRSTDRFIPLQRRADIANNAKADLFISIHTNALPSGRLAYGSETYTLGMARANANLDVAKRENSVIALESDYQRTYQGFDPNKAESYVIFEIMQDKYMKQSVDLASRIQKQYTSAGRPNKGVHQAGFLVLRNTSMPSVLTELGFITTPKEESYLNSAQGMAELSRSIYNGFLDYRRLHDKTAHALPDNLPNVSTAPTPDMSLSPSSAQSPKDVAVVPVEVKTSVQIEAERKQKRETPKQENEVGTAEKQSTTSAKPIKTSAIPAKEKTTSSKDKTSQPKEKSSQSKEKASSAKEAKNTSKSADKAQKTEKKQNATSTGVRYRIQLGAGKTEIATNDPQFKGLTVQRVKEGSLYKYFYGSYHTYAEAQQALRTVKAKLPSAYIAAYVGGKVVTVAEARAQEKK